MRRLGEVCGGRDNNLNLIRMIAASAVLISHAWPIALGAGAVEPLQTILGVTLGTAAVYVFFAISGFLVARSFETTPAVEAWIAARALRLFPGLIVVTTLTALLLGPAVTSLAVADYFTHPEVVSYVPRNVTLVALQYGLPGVFENNPSPVAINGSLWTLFYEVSCYAGVCVAGLLGAFRARRTCLAVLACYVLFYLAEMRLSAIDPEPGAVSALLYRLDKLAELSLPFAIGVLFHVLRARLPLGWFPAAAGVAVAAALHGTPVFHEAFVLALSYATFVAAYLPGGWLRFYNVLGDYSYGVYVYAFPTQQTVAHLFGPMSPVENILIAAPVTLALAILSWVAVEKPALALKGRASALFARAGVARPRR